MLRDLAEISSMEILIFNHFETREELSWTHGAGHGGVPGVGHAPALEDLERHLVSMIGL